MRLARCDDIPQAPEGTIDEVPLAARGALTSFARALARVCGAVGAQAVLVPGPWPRDAVGVGAPAPLALDVVDLLVASDCVIVPTERMPSAAARAAARAWSADRLLVAPALHGDALVAVGLAPLLDSERPDVVGARRAGARLGAALAHRSDALRHRLASV